jgi:hypothetical protein
VIAINAQMTAVKVTRQKWRVNMNSLFVIDAQLSAILDNPENYDVNTGELLPVPLEQARVLEGDKQTKIKNCRNYFQALKANIDAAEEEKAKIAAYITHCERVQEQLKNLVKMFVPEGEKINDPGTGRQLIGWRKSKQTIINDDDKVLKYCIEHNREAVVFPAPYIDKTKLKEILENGVCIDGAKLKNKNNIQIK